MITVLRNRLGTWFSRILFGVLVVAFSIWGIGDVIKQVGSETWVAKVGDRAIEPQELQQAYQQQLNQITRMLGGRVDPTPEMKRGVLGQALDQLIKQYAVSAELTRMRIVVPESALGHDVMALPAFRGPDGQFNRLNFQNALRNAGMTESRFMERLRAENAQRQLLEPLRASLVPPQILTREVFQFTTEQREAGVVELPFASIPAPEPTAAQLQRWYDNHPDLYTKPEYRRIKAVILAPQTLQGEIEVSDADILAAYEARRTEFVTPEKRTAEIIIVQEEAKAAEFTALWRGGATWEAMQKAATDAGGAPVALSDATQPEFPDPALAAAVFAAAESAVSDPIKTALGWQVLRVTKITAGATRSLAETTDELRTRIVAERAADIIYQRATKIEDTLAGGTNLDEMPGNLGLAAITGTMDAQGNTLAGEPAPIPGPPEMRTALVSAAFLARQGDSVKLVEVPSTTAGSPSYYAVAVEEIIPPGLKPYADVMDAVKDDATHFAQRRAQEEIAAKLLGAVQAGQSLEDAATVAGVTYRRTPRTGRTEPAEGFPRELVEPIFAAKKGEATMVATAEAFLVAAPVEIVQTDPKADEAGYARISTGLAQAMANDAETAFVNALRLRAKPRVNQKIVDSFVQP